MVGSVVNMIMGESRPPVPERGMGATILSYSDRAAATVVLVNIAKTSVFVTRDTAKRIDKNGMSESQEYEYTSNMEDTNLQEYTLRKNGAWVRVKESMRNGQRLLLGHRETYHDFSF